MSGLMPDTPLGQTVSIRAETDSKVIKNFTDAQMRIRDEWILRQCEKDKENPEAYLNKWKGFQRMLKEAFSN